MKKVGIVVNRDKDIGFRYTRMIAEKLCAKGFTPIAEPDLQKLLGPGTVSSDNVSGDSDFIVCLGGDGTFLKAAREAYGHRVPVLGINMGTVGFLAEVETHDIEWAIDRMADGKITVQSRMALAVRVIRSGETVFSDIAINDAVVSRVALSRILRLKVSMDDQYVDSFPGDGVILSTPTGSTGYSLSAGGPIVQPDMRLIIISPICPHILYSRSFISSDKKTIRVSIDDYGDIKAMLTMDGQAGLELMPGDLVEIRSAPVDALFASVSRVNFYDVLRAKIHVKME